ncbi:LysE family translocator [Saccharospirillum alexandrii]|uniref:LysE family translocator n=1 Tax=Saccharospirillum alexandrii TaxID=2448477 RepID=UPI000FD6F50B|nr:LysE family translocator [Saccharospirillum alexandrii]
MPAWWPFVLVYTAAVISPGPDFALVVKSALTRGKRASTLNALGIGLGVTLHTLVAVLGVSALVQSSRWLAMTLPWLGIGYLLYLGWGGLSAQPTPPGQPLDSSARVSDRSDFWQGFLTNVLNPKALLFFSAILLQLVDGLNGWMQSALVGYVFVVTSLWFGLVGWVLSQPVLQRRFLTRRHWIDRGAGVIFVALSLLFIWDWWQRWML